MATKVFTIMYPGNQNKLSYKYPVNSKKIYRKKWNLMKFKHEGNLKSKYQI